MVKFIANKTLTLLLLAALAIASASALAPVRARQASPSVPSTSKAGQNEVLAREIVRLFNEDQALLAELQNAKKNPAFQQTLESYVDRSKVKKYNPNFYDSVVYALWAQVPDAPEIVRRYVKFRKATDARVQSIVAENGWPQRAAVGDEAAADFFFLFGHADGDNVWRMTQLATLKRVFREDHVNPRLYAHLCDRLANVAGEPQIYGSVMGPGDIPGSAKLYWPLIDNMAAADKRRAQIGLPSIESDLEKFRQGAEIGPYMTPIEKGKGWSIADVYMTP
ncbi:DUF6624 domain-containing protein [Alloacidobacterium sp.]|uniref:DUF6624 domain-containing protein n=1 Tax=Alloacidobacterium sp. TaxID=2951999 RepID=UPI002D62A1F4|nr:DUF6624 domain-containing protein [Alloacidobacterium sp.]HYK35002.1 DUF6624 domain-containing protein [Alloacidobacterium sp.]